MRKYYISLFILICDFSFAQVVSLTCINPQDNFTLNFQLNECDSSIIMLDIRSMQTTPPQQ